MLTSEYSRSANYVLLIPYNHIGVRNFLLLLALHYADVRDSGDKT